jgi:hypothetical protein
MNMLRSWGCQQENRFCQGDYAICSWISNTSAVIPSPLLQVD